MYDLAFPWNSQHWLRKQVETFLVWSVLLHTHTLYVFEGGDVGHPTPSSPHPLPQKEVVKETYALKPQILQNYFLATGCCVSKMFQGMTVVFQIGGS